MTFQLSLKWKVIIVFGLVLLSIHGLLSGLTIIILNQQFENQRSEAQAKHEKTIQSLIFQSSRLLQQIAETIPLLSENFKDTNDDKIVATLNNYWDTFQLAWGIEGIQYFDDSGNLIDTWGLVKSTNYNQVNDVLAKEKPVFFIQCTETCLQYIAIPILGDSSSNKVLVISKNLADIVIDFKTIAHADLGILAPNPTIPEDNKNYWDHYLAAITDPQQSIVILKNTTTRFSLQKITEKGAVLNLNEKIYEVKSFKLKSNEINSLILVVIDDITKNYLSQKQNTTNYIASGVLSLFIGIILLLILLREPLQRVTNLAQILPMLAEGKYISVRRQLSYLDNKFPGVDEIDHLENTVLQLSYKLESMQKKIEYRTQILAKQRQTLERERNFVQELLDTAPLIILTQDPNGSIITINQFGKNVLAEEVYSKSNNYDEIFLINESEASEARHELSQLRKGETLKARFESKLINESHSLCITWFHTKLNQSDSDYPIILSIGLDITDRKIAEDRLIWLADHDPLTHLYNRRRFQQEFDKILHESFKQNYSGAILYFDLDQFKYVNDTCGHKAGDSLLQLIADTLRHTVRSTDLIARLGGDEFALVIQNVDKAGAIQIAEKIFNALRSIDYDVNGQPFKITVSIGIAMFPEHGHNIQDLLANADLAMYQAKESGRGKIHAYSPQSDFQLKLKTQVYWRDQIERALLEDRFVLHFQPILNIQTQNISHYETLLRMIDDQGNIVPPGQFIPIAEQIGLIGEIDRMVIRKALAAHILLRNHNFKITLSINLSGQALADLELQESICAMLCDKNVDPSLIIFEITETIAVSNFSSAQNLMKEIKSMGCKFAIDDFGVGFSSFYYLMHLPVDYVKIDGSFIKEIITNKEYQVLVQALAGIAQGLGKKTIAEFVESKEILMKLRTYGIHYAQGFYIGRPSPHLPISETKALT